ncbi:MAG: Rdx family protein [Planctomycetes bacterium]|nr:hypothetical protein [Planctomycetota bacterium]MBL7007658.1 Rdx family protein [Planctomycetota bacterium]
MPHATSLAAELKESFHVDPVLIEGSGGDFEVKVDGEVVWDKLRLEPRFPDRGEITAIIQQR